MLDELKELIELLEQYEGQDFYDIRDEFGDAEAERVSSVRHLFWRLRQQLEKTRF